LFESELIKAALQQGLWAVLFVSLYVYQLKDSRRLQDEARVREEKLTGFITDITKQFENLARQFENMSNDISEIKDEIKDR
jgi:hypothetical protein